jgi:eukaryotic-like serine/threonine-protein kinase
MDMGASFVLPEDVLVFPASELAPDLLAQAPMGADDYVVTRPNAREPSTVIDKNGAALLESFRRASTIVDVVIEFSRGRGLDPQTVLGEAFPLLHKLARANFLVPADSLQAQRIEPTFQLGEDFAEWTVQQTAHIVDDTEVYRMRDATGRSAALKIARPGHEGALRPAFRHESAVLSYLDGVPAPRLLDAGERDGRPFLLTEWRQGEPALSLARRLQHNAGPGGMARVLPLCLAVLRAYAALHARGVVHGDIHPNNLLATEDHVVHILDFGRARILDDAGPLGSPPRGGAAFYFDPKHAKAMLAESVPPPVDPGSEQYCLAVLLREMLVGRPYLDFSLESQHMLRQIVEDRPTTFVQHGATPWPDVERVLGRALAKTSAERFASVADFADALSRAGRPNRPASAPTNGAAPELLSEVLARVGIERSAFKALDEASPLCSVNTGAAGVAYALYRIASVREDTSLLALAELWIERAERHASKDEAFFSELLDLSPATVGRISLFHTAAGVSCVEGLIAIALGDAVRLAGAVGRFVTRSQGACDNLDLTLGRSSTLIGCAALLAALPQDVGEARSAILGLGDGLAAAIRGALAASPAIGAGEGLNLGVAHGWGGVLFALLRWQEVASRGSPDTAIETYLNDLAAKGEAAGEGLRWQWITGRRGPKEFMAGWCNGSGGLAHLWTLAERLYGRDEYGELARRAALNACEEPPAIGDLCCGAAGRAYAMLDLYRHTGDGIWVDRARGLADRAATLIREWSLHRDSLYKGEVGVALLSADLGEPELSCMPLFNKEP